MERTLILTSPHLKGSVVKDVQFLLRNNHFGNFGPGLRDGEYGEKTAAATRRAKYALGYAHPDRKFGPKLYDYLSGKRKLSAAMRLRRKLRLRKQRKVTTRKGKALALGLIEAKARVTEYPPGSNLQKYGRWYGFNGVPWCAIFVSWCMNHAGLPLRTALAFQWEYWGRAHSHGLSITHDPEPGDIVVYHHGQGHTGIFYRWVDRSGGHFQAVEGNTSAAGSQDNGGAVLVKDRYTGWAPTVFVRVGR